ncbi:hypothetical protein Tco_0087547 [Tanacetum coccineum]
MRDDDGFFYFKFESIKGMEQVLEQGSWLIQNSPLILNKWSVNMSLSKDDVKKVLVWVKMLKVPVVAYTEDGLSRITSQIRRPIMVDSFTSEMCDATWGRMGYARALIEISVDKALKQEVVMVVSIEDGAGHTLERIKLEYEWKPPLCNGYSQKDKNKAKKDKTEHETGMHSYQVLPAIMEQLEHGVSGVSCIALENWRALSRLSLGSKAEFIIFDSGLTN